MSEFKAAVAARVGAAREASRQLAAAGGSARSRGLTRMAEQLERCAEQVLAENRRDVAQAEAAGMRGPLLERLRVDAARLGQLCELLREIAATPDVVGRLERPWRAPNGLEVGRMRIPLGVVAMIYESRPPVTIQAAGCCIRSGNAVILRGGSEAVRTNLAFAEVIAPALESAGLPATAVQLLPWTDRAVILHLLEHEDEIDVVIPRGGESLIRFVCENSRIPVLRNHRGVCHVYVHAAADLDMALAICIDSKAVRPFTCHTAETFLVDAAVAERFLPRLCARLQAAGVEIRGDDATRRMSGTAVKPATQEDWRSEYLDYIVSIRVVDDIAAALAHIARYATHHTESIVTQDEEAAALFLRQVGSSTVLVNASTRLADLPSLGLGPELGTSTTKLHAYGPMGAEELTTTKLVVRGAGHLKG
jgi:glutamate-5-semialdehyde dehydrogenase